MKKILLIAVSGLIFSVTAKAQLACGTDQVCNQLREQHPEIKEWEIILGASIKEAIDRKKEELKYARTTATTYDIPLVIHVVHDYGLEYLSDDDIFEAVAFWDKVFNKENADTIDVISNFKKYIGNPQIRLRLATKDPSGNPTKGIVRHHSYMTTRGSDQAKIGAWPNNKYLNLWFINKFDASHSGAAAYSYYPSTAAFIPHFDGVISVFSYLNYDKTIPHEIGHSLNLAHPWGSTNNPGVACGDDEVDDTPPTYGHTSCSIADLYDTRCATGYVDSKGTFIPNSPLAADTSNTQNIMDYSYCSKMFTIGQANRMRAALTSSVAGRNNLFSGANLAATGALSPRPDLKPVPDFSVERAIMSWGGGTAERTVFLCQNSSTLFQLRNRSWNDTITALKWTLSNGASTPSSTTIAGAVTSNFTTPGWVTIQLEATGNNSGTATMSKKALYVASTSAYARGYNQYFNMESDFQDWPMFNHYGNTFKWEYNGSNGFPSGWGCIRYRSYDTRTAPESFTEKQSGDFDDLYTPAFNLDDVAGMTPSGTMNLNFYTAGASIFAAAYNDSLQIFASTTCGDSWVRVASLKGTDLANNGSMVAEFAPTNAGQWKAQTINIPASLRSPATFFRFRYWPSEGSNNLYFDNFAISPWTTSVKEVAENNSDVNIIPNPSAGNATLCFTATDNENVTINIRDITGKTLYSQNAQYPKGTFVEFPIVKSIFPATGMYLVSLVQSNKTQTLKLSIQ